MQFDETDFNRLCGLGKQELASLVESIAGSVDERIVAGNLLAMLGDPRISTLDPQMIDVAGGNVTIGINESDVERVLHEFSGLGIHRSWIEKETPSFTIGLADFRIQKYPVTNIDFLAFLQDTGHPDIPSSWVLGRFPTERSNHPVYSVLPATAECYATWLTKKTGRLFGLPTEVEWEYSAAGPDRHIFPWGNSFSPDFANTAEAGYLNTTPVGCFVEGRSPFGVFDMAGNVEEYVHNDYAPYPGGKFITDHLNECGSTYRIARGGSFARFRDLCRNSRRHGFNPRAKVYVVGFRLVERQ